MWTPLAPESGPLLGDSPDRPSAPFTRGCPAMRPSNWNPQRRGREPSGTVPWSFDPSQLSEGAQNRDTLDDKTAHACPERSQSILHFVHSLHKSAAFFRHNIVVPLAISSRHGRAARICRSLRSLNLLPGLAHVESRVQLLTPKAAQLSCLCSVLFCARYQSPAAECGASTHPSCRSFAQ